MEKYRIYGPIGGTKYTYQIQEYFTYSRFSKIFGYKDGYENILFALSKSTAKELLSIFRNGGVIFYNESGNEVAERPDIGLGLVINVKDFIPYVLINTENSEEIDRFYSLADFKKYMKTVRFKEEIILKC